MTKQLVVEHVSKVFGGLKAVADVSLTIDQGSLIALIGPNGAGKTTLFNMLTGESGPTTGKITLNTATGAVDITKKKAFQVAKLGVARTFQNIRLFGAMSVKENVLVARTHLYHESFLGTVSNSMMWLMNQLPACHMGRSGEWKLCVPLLLSRNYFF